MAWSERGAGKAQTQASILLLGAVLALLGWRSHVGGKGAASGPGPPAESQDGNAPGLRRATVVRVPIDELPAAVGDTAGQATARAHVPVTAAATRVVPEPPASAPARPRAVVGGTDSADPAAGPRFSPNYPLETRAARARDALPDLFDIVPKSGCVCVCAARRPCAHACTLGAGLRACASNAACRCWQCGQVPGAWSTTLARLPVWHCAQPPEPAWRGACIHCLYTYNSCPGGRGPPVKHAACH